MDFQHWLHEAVNQLRDSDSPRRDAEILLEYVTGKGRTYIMALAKRRLLTSSNNSSRICCSGVDRANPLRT